MKCKIILSGILLRRVKEISYGKPTRIAAGVSQVFKYIFSIFICISSRYLYLFGIHTKHDAIFFPFMTLYSSCISICLLLFLRSETVAVICGCPIHNLVYAFKDLLIKRRRIEQMNR